MNLKTAMDVANERRAKGQFVFPTAFNGEYEGMLLRDWFAGQALIALSTRWGGTLGDIDNIAAMRSAVIAYELADAMLKERERK